MQLCLFNCEVCPPDRTKVCEIGANSCFYNTEKVAEELAAAEIVAASECEKEALELKQQLHQLQRELGDLQAQEAKNAKELRECQQQLNTQMQHQEQLLAFLRDWQQNTNKPHWQ
eukprot:TRINITY_DN2911_c0_g1_i2.p1 TRINITY_DN2911_c0_g1~~TRINITY_DN2911_c0_g1_i2.p1  ORF type:complete len:115 (-),score=49.42 TRINITY_DN2911_c0_g1_i2:60-404(-)